MKFTLNSGRDQYNSNTVKDKAKAVAQSTVATVQDTVQSGLAKTQDTLQTGLSAAQDALQQNVKRANKSLKKAKRSIKDVQESVQDQLAGYRRKRKLARVLFRLGLLVGIALALLYTPWPGSDTRRQLAAWWQRISSSMTNRT